MKAKVLFFVALAIAGCTSKPTSEETTVNDTIATAANEQTIEVINGDPKTIGDIPLPEGFERVPIEDTTSFAYFLRNLPLKPLGTPVMTYDGYEAWTTDVAYAVIDAYGPSNEDIQQCADAIIRLRAEWLYKNKRYDEIAFHFTNGWLCEYKRWAEGDRVAVNGNKTSWYKAAADDYSYQNFLQYLKIVFNYAGTLSLEKELVRAYISDIQAGDVFIKGGSPGHSIIVVDVAQRTSGDHKGEKCFIVAESYMPAQDIHVLKNVNQGFDIFSPWYSNYAIIRDGEDYNFASYSFSGFDLKQFK